WTRSVGAPARASLPAIVARLSWMKEARAGSSCPTAASASPAPLWAMSWRAWRRDSGSTIMLSGFMRHSPCRFPSSFEDATRKAGRAPNRHPATRRGALSSQAFERKEFAKNVLREIVSSLDSTGRPAYNSGCSGTIGVISMAARRILVSWIGHADLVAMADDLGDAGKELLAAAKVFGKNGEKPGRVKTAVELGKFDEVHLLSNYAEPVHKPFASWLGGKPVIHPVELPDPTDYSQIFRCVNGVLGGITSRPQRK